MTENDSQKLDLILKMLDQHDKRFEQIEEARKEDRAEWRRGFDEQNKQREEDRAEWRRGFDEQNKQREKDRVEWRRGFDEIKYDLRLDKEKLEKVYEARNQVTVSFSRAFATANAAIAGVLAVMVSMFWNK